MQKIAIYIFVCFSFLFLLKSHVYAAVLFSDDFEQGSSQWTPIRGPNLWQVNNGRYGAVINNGGTILVSAAGSIGVSDYKIDLDMFTVQGEDKNVEFRWRNNNGNATGVHFTNGGARFYAHGVNTSNPYPLENNHQYHIQAILNGQNIKFYIDNNLLFDEIDPDYQFQGNEQMVLVVTTGASFPTEVYFDNIVISTLDEALDVQLLKQTDLLWGSELYDSANLWSTGGTDISTWGCALTSAAMVFQYNGINKMPDDTDLTPGTMNTWLKSQPDGYVRNGLVNWLALSRLSRLSKPNNSYSFDALEYDRVNHQDDALLGKSIAENIPPILEEPGHFIVATGTDSANTTFFINDPYYLRTSLVDPAYNKNYLSMGTYTPSSTDLSYLMFVVDPDVSINLLNNSGENIGETYLQSPIQDPLGISNNNIGLLKMLYFKKPSSGNYSVLLSSNVSEGYTLQSYEYDINGNVKQNAFTGVVGNNNSDTYLINFDKDNSNNSSAYQEVTFMSLKNDIKTFYSLGKIKKAAFKNLLLLQVDLAEKLSTKSKKATKALLVVVKSQIQKEKGKKITTDAADILIDELNVLISKY